MRLMQFHHTKNVPNKSSLYMGRLKMKNRSLVGQKAMPTMNSTLLGRKRQLAPTLPEGKVKDLGRLRSSYFRWSGFA